MNIEEIKKSISADLEHITKQNELNDIKSKYLGKEGVITLLQSKIREIPNEEKKEYGIKVNEVRTYFNTLFEEVKTRIETEEINRKLEKEAIDITLPSEEIATGSLHPFNRIIEEVEDIFVSMGYDVVPGNEVETDEYAPGVIISQSRPAGSIIAERVNLKIKVTKKSETEAGSDHTNTDDGMVPYEEGNNN